mmetsp:Transcript_825/g.1247  ORF Transcript_825/g.1247 Transcript_825/m.1247 type:complete len:118 (+) Transcript_825:232-585(+)|eukprot:CAMPEP_0170465324 /NCGR_PEP_ID=MMETSP0123-20130129/9708_1 /TAXON_ID=182087 /ORGANISM="Favella ehrenbergii, Strain Fehren 1" /LENGTH=117 /DNA_ID=CAMNT_0010731187 /DNA_START=214 /DNA_END=567 /DNA_ORIENTATION=+
MLAFEHGYMPETAQQVYETEWFYSTHVDHFEHKERTVVFNPGKTDEEIQAFIERFGVLIRKLDAHWADGRTYVGGEKMTHADFVLLNLIVGWYDNPNGLYDACKEATQKMLQECPNV